MGLRSAERRARDPARRPRAHVSAMRRRAARGPGPPPPPPPGPGLRPLPLLLLLALGTRGGCAAPAPAPRAEDLSLGVVSARPRARGRDGRGAPGPESGVPAGRVAGTGKTPAVRVGVAREPGRPGPISWVGRLRLGRGLSGRASARES